MKKLHTSKGELVFWGEKRVGSESELVLWAVLKMLLYNDMQKNTSYNQLQTQKCYTMYPEENPCAFTDVRWNKFNWVGVNLWKFYHFWNIFEERNDVVVFELNWIRKLSWSWKAMEKVVQINFCSLHNKNRKNDSIKETD